MLYILEQDATPSILVSNPQRLLQCPVPLKTTLQKTFVSFGRTFEGDTAHDLTPDDLHLRHRIKNSDKTVSSSQTKIEMKCQTAKLFNTMSELPQLKFSKKVFVNERMCYENGNSRIKKRYTFTWSWMYEVKSKTTFNGENCHIFRTVDTEKRRLPCQWFSLPVSPCPLFGKDNPNMRQL